MSRPDPTNALRETGTCDACDRAVAWTAACCEHCGATFDPEALVDIFVTADAQLLPLLKSALDAAGVPHVVQGEAALGLFPLGPLATGLTRNLVAATIHVPRGFAAAAVDVLTPNEEDAEHEEDEDDGEDEP